MTADELAARCLAELREKKVQALVRALRNIADDGPEKEPVTQKGSDEDVLLAYEDGYADASYRMAEMARAALIDWEEDTLAFRSTPQRERA